MTEKKNKVFIAGNKMSNFSGNSAFYRYSGPEDSAAEIVALSNDVDNFSNGATVISVEITNELKNKMEPYIANFSKDELEEFEQLLKGIGSVNQKEAASAAEKLKRFGELLQNSSASITILNWLSTLSF